MCNDDIILELLKEVKDDQKQIHSNLKSQGILLHNIQIDVAKNTMDLSKNTQDIEEHIRRTNIIEEKVVKLEEPQIVLKGIKKIGGWIAGVGGAILIVLKFLDLL